MSVLDATYNELISVNMLNDLKKFSEYLANNYYLESVMLNRYGVVRDCTLINKHCDITLEDFFIGNYEEMAQLPTLLWGTITKLVDLDYHSDKPQIERASNYNEYRSTE